MAFFNPSNRQHLILDHMEGISGTDEFAFQLDRFQQGLKYTLVDHVGVDQSVNIDKGQL
ncbi:hypothetical protein D3C74_332930 [compost metagenome]